MSSGHKNLETIRIWYWGGGGDRAHMDLIEDGRNCESAELVSA